MGSGNGHFATTRWSVVARAAESSSECEEALQQLCESYWQPLYVFVRGKGHNRQDAADLTQAFFVHVLEKKVFEKASQHRGKFRSFLLACVQNFLRNDYDRQNAVKRGGSVAKFQLDPTDAESRFAVLSKESTPELVFEKEWANSLLSRVHERLRESLGDQRAEFHNEILKFLTVESESGSYDEVARNFGMTKVAVRVAVFRLRDRFRDILRDEIKQTLQDDDSVEEEIAYLQDVIASK